MDITKFIHMFGKHKVRVLDSGYITLRVGETIRPGDEAYTWTTPDCNELGWIPVPKENWHEPCTEETVEIRRKKVATMPSRKIVKQSANTDHLPARTQQIAAIEATVRDHNMMYGMICYEAFGRTINKKHLTINDAEALLEAAQTILERRKTTTNRVLKRMEL